MDLASGHVAALGRLLGSDPLEHSAVNLGTGRGQSVLEVVRAFEAASGRSIPYDVVERRAGDVAVSYADAGLAQRYLGWKAMRGPEAMCADAWRWQSANPRGYGDA
jgi:UDP-glucose 4-epimerase